MPEQTLFFEIWAKWSWPMKLHDFLKSNISPEKKYEKSWFFACWYKSIEIKSRFKNFRVEMFINGCDHASYRTQKLAVSHEEINRIKWFLVFEYKFRKA